jgi:hypothetical protein
MTLILALALLAQPGDIAALGAPRWADREAAEKRLDAGPIEAALPGLHSRDPEIRRRALRSIRRKSPCISCDGSGVHAHWVQPFPSMKGFYVGELCATCGGWGSKWLQRRMAKGKA